MYKVNQGGDRFIVDLEGVGCICRKWNLIRIPYAHAIHVIYEKRFKLEDYVSKYYRKDIFLSLYK